MIVSFIFKVFAPNLLFHDIFVIKLEAIKDEQTHTGILECRFLQEKERMIQSIGKQKQVYFREVVRTQDIPYGCPKFQMEEVCQSWYLQVKPKEEMTKPECKFHY